MSGWERKTECDKTERLHTKLCTAGSGGFKTMRPLRAYVSRTPAGQKTWQVSGSPFQPRPSALIPTYLHCTTRQQVVVRTGRGHCHALRILRRNARTDSHRQSSDFPTVTTGTVSCAGDNTNKCPLSSTTKSNHEHYHRTDDESGNIPPRQRHHSETLLPPFSSRAGRSPKSGQMG